MDRQNTISNRFFPLLLPLLVALFACGPDLQAQYSDDAFNLKSAASQYDQQGFQQGRSLTLDGKLVVSNATGALNYVYPLAERVVNGQKLTYALNYCGSVGFTAFAGYADNKEPFSGWNRFHQNRAAWILGVNGFAVQVISTTNSFLSEPKRVVDDFSDDGIYHTSYSDQDFVWTIDGYDQCGRMDNFNADGRTKPYVDVIHLLRSDGSVLDLMNRSSATYLDAYAHTDPFTGVYFVNAANNPGFAVVSFDSSEFGPYMRSRGMYGYAKVPRVVRYYDGSGLEYVFREWTLPYGFQMTGEWAPSYTAGLSYAGPSIFYLEEINNVDGHMALFYRSRHFWPRLRRDDDGVIAQGDTTLDSTRGRAACVEMGGIEITYGDIWMNLEGFGRTIQVRYDTVARSGYAGTAGEPTGIPIASNERNAFLTARTNYPYLIDGDYTDGRYRSYVGYVTEIRDVQAHRVTTFDYEQYTRTYTDYFFPDKCFGCGLTHGPPLVLKNYRLKEVVEPTARYEICYHQKGSDGPAIGEVCGADDKSVSANSHDAGDPYANNNVVRALRKYDRDDQFQSEITYEYLFPMENGSYMSTSLATTLRTHDIVTDSVHMTKEDFKIHTLPQIFPFFQGPRYTELYLSSDSTGSLTTWTRSHYFTPDATHPYVWLLDSVSVEQSMGSDENDALLKSRQIVRYELDTVNHFGGNDTLAGAYGMAVAREFRKTLDPASLNPIRFDTTEYLHLPLVDTTVTTIDTLYRKLISEEEFLAGLDSADRASLTELSWEVAARNAGSRYDTTITLDHLPPVYGLKQRAWGYDSTGALLGGEIMTYAPDDVAGGSYLKSFLYRGNLIGDTLIDHAGRHFLKQALDYYRYYAINAPDQVTNANGAVVRMSYQDYGSNTLYQDGPEGDYMYALGHVLENDDTLRDTLLPVIPTYSLLYEKPMLHRSLVRNYDAAGTLGYDTLDVMHQHSYFGQEVATIDENGWFSGYQYDRVGRLRYAWLPRDFMREKLDGDTLYDRYDGLPAFAQTVHVTRIDTLISNRAEDDDSLLIKGVPTEEWPDGAYASHPVLPERPTFKSSGPKTHKRDGDAAAPQALGTVKTFVAQDEYYVDYHLTLDTARLHAFTAIDSAFIRFNILGVQGGCVAIRVAGVEMPLSRKYVFGCNLGGTTGVGSRARKREERGGLQGASATSPALAEYSVEPLRIDITSAVNALRGSSDPNPVAVDIYVTTAGGQITFADGFDGEDTRARVDIYGPSHYTFATDDYTLAYSYDDSTNDATVSAKVDDRDHSANTLPLGSAGGNGRRHARTLNHFGPDYEVRSSLIPIGNPDDPERVDSVLTNWTGIGLKQTVVDQVNDSMTIRYDGAGRPIETINADGSSSTMAYYLGDPTDFGITDQDFSGFCSVAVTTDEDGVKLARYTDAFDRLRREVADSGSTAFDAHLNLTTRYEYDLENRLRLVIDPKGDTTRYYYDAAGRVRYKYHPDLGTTSYAYDDLGNVRFSQTEEQARTNKLTFSQYDDLNRLTLTGEAILTGEDLPDTTIPRGDTVNLDRLTDRFDPKVLHDSAGSMLTASKSLWLEPEIVTPKFFHPSSLDTASACTLSADTLLGETSTPPAPYLRHPATFWEPVTSPAASRNRFENVAAFPHFARIGVAYDALPERSGAVWGRFPEWDQWDSLAPRGVIRNLKGRETAVAYREHGGEPFHFAVMSYDERGRVEALLHYTENLGFDAVWYSYNSSSQVTSVKVIDRLRQFTTWYGYDWNGRVDTVWTHLSGVGTGLGVATALRPAVDTVRDWPADIVYSYTPAGQIETMRYDPVGVLVQYAYNHRKWLDSMVASGTGGPLFVQALTYDAAGQVMSQTWQHGAGGRTTHWYDYDNLRRLDQWEAPGDTTFYVYDAKGNRVDEEHIPGGEATTSLYGDAVATDRLTQTSTISGPETRASYYGYDPNGAVTGIRHTSSLHLPDTDSLEYSWRGLTRRYLHFDYNGLGGVTSNEDWRYRYNAGGEREQKRLYWQQDSAHRIVDHKSWVYYLLGGKKEQLAVYHGQETDTSLLCIGQEGAEVYLYPSEYLSYGINSAANVAILPTVGKEFRIADHLGSLRVAMRPTGIMDFDYSPWGEALSSLPARKGYIDKERDRESGLMNLGSRMYDHRFLSPDRLWESSISVSPYAYSGNNPITFKDPIGDSAWSYTNDWDRAEIASFRSFVQQRAEVYRKNGVAFTCEDFALALLIDFASSRGLPLRLESNSGKVFDAADDKFSDALDFKRSVMRSFGARDLQNENNTKHVSLDDSRPGDLLLSRYDDGSAHHTQVITSITDRYMDIYQGNSTNIGRAPGLSFIWNTGDPASLHYCGLPVQIGSIDLMTGAYVRDNTYKANYFASSNIDVRQWRFDLWRR